MSDLSGGRAQQGDGEAIPVPPHMPGKESSSMSDASTKSLVPGGEEFEAPKRSVKVHCSPWSLLAGECLRWTAPIEIGDDVGCGRGSMFCMTYHTSNPCQHSHC
jgi:hypothetical protein